MIPIPKQIFSFTIPVEPQGKGRPRFARDHVYTPQKTVKFESVVTLFANSAKIPVLTGCVWVQIIAIKTRPKRLMGKKYPDGLIFCPTKPDKDNIEKIICDSLNNVLYQDDCKVVAGDTVKLYCEKTGLPRVIVRIGQYDDEFMELKIEEI